MTDLITGDGLVIGADGLARCAWGGSTPDYEPYHDHEWGRPVHGDDALFERLTLEAFQSGLSWITILRKRPAFRAAFAGFSIPAVAAFTEADASRLMADAGIVRNRAKIEATIDNAKTYLKLRERTTLKKLIWNELGDEGPLQRGAKGMGDIPAENEISKRISKKLKSEGFRFVGPTTVYAFMQSAGLVNDHLVGCFRYADCAKLQKAAQPS